MNILITGSTGHIGQAIAKEFAAQGPAIALHYHASEKTAKELAAELGGHAKVIQADIRVVSEIKRMISEVGTRLGGLDLLVHCAAVFERTPFDEVTGDKWDEIISVNLRPAFFVAQAAWGIMKDRGGGMIFLSDVAASKPYGGYLPYCISKAGINALVRGLARSLAPKVRVNAIAPYIVTRPQETSDKGWNDILSKTPMRRASSPKEIAAVAKLLAFSAETITGQVITVDGGRGLK